MSETKIEFKNGDKVHYDPEYGKKENGIVKRVTEDGLIAFVVYYCNEEWDNYRKYTAIPTGVEGLKLGWV